MTTERGDWRALGACVGHPQVDRLWFAEMDGRITTAEIRHRQALAVEVCQRCVVRFECLTEALRVPSECDLVGVVGGHTAEERRAMRGPQGPRLVGADRHKVSAAWRGGRAGPDARQDAERPQPRLGYGGRERPRK